MKRRLKKINRGLVLAAVLIVGLIIYICIDNHNFKTEKPQIESNISGFVNGLAEFNVTPEKYRELGKTYSADDAEKLRKDFSGYVEEYWVSSDDFNDPYEFIVKKNDMKALINQKLDSPMGYITEFEAQLRNCKISKDGPNAAIAECEIKVICKGTSESGMLLPTEYFFPGGMYGDSEQTEELYNISADEACTVYLERTSDGWKITGCEGYLMGYQSYPAVETE